MLSGSQTRLLYVFVFLISTIFASMSRKKSLVVDGNPNESLKKSFRKSHFVFALLIAWTLIAFTNIGVDYNNYYEIINRISWENYFAFFDEEPLMNFVFLVLRDFLGSAHIVIFVIKTLTVAFFGFSIYQSRDKINIPFSVLSYLGFIYLPSFYLITICFSASIVAIAFSICFTSNKKLLPIIIVLVAAQFHNSAYLMLPVIVACVYRDIFAKTPLKKLFLFAIFIIVVLFSSTIYNFFLNYVEGFHYIHYGDNSFSGSGLMAVLKIAPLFVFYYICKKKKYDKITLDLMFILIISNALFIILSYKFTIIERMEFYFLPLYSMVFSNVLECSLMKSYSPNRKTISLEALSIYMYFLFRIALVFMDRVSASSGLDNFIFFNPFM